MTDIPLFSPNAVRTIEVLAFPEAQLLDVAGPLQVFASANRLARDAGRAVPYATAVVGRDSEVVTSAGLGLRVDWLPVAGPAVDTLLIAGGEGVEAAAADPVLLGWVRTRAAGARRVASVCTGAFLLASAGLLDGRRAVTHWSRCDDLARAFPSVRVDPDPIFIQDGNVWTSAGVTAGIDLALAMVEQDLGQAAALAVARQLVVFLKRPGGQAQFSAFLSRQHGDDRWGALHSWIADNLAGDLSVSVLADRAGMTERSFVRHYRRQTGTTPARAVEQLRVEAARQLLCDTGLPLKRVAQRCGFGSEETMRRSFLRVVTTAPRDYRERHGGVSARPAS